MKIAVTGARGLLGWHFRCHLHARSPAGVTIAEIDRAAFASDRLLQSALKGAEFVVHLAGVNRDAPERLEQENREIARRMAAFLSRLGETPHLIYANSVHCARNEPYGRGKAAASRHLAAWAESCGALYTDLILPQVFGEGGRPFYNSVVHTFCHQIVSGQERQINPEGMLELVHAQDVAAAILDAFEKRREGALRVSGSRIAVLDVEDRLSRMHQQYAEHEIPDLRDPLALALFNTLRSFLYPVQFPRPLALRTDDRGSLFEAVKSRGEGQAFLSTTKPGITRGNHFHLRKLERFLVLSGQAVIRIRKLGSEQVDAFTVSGDAPAYIDIPTLHTHSIENTGRGDLLTLFWSHEIFNPEAPDTYSMAVMPALEGGE